MECSRRGPTGSRAPSTARAASNRACPLALVRAPRSEEHTSELQSLAYLVCRLLLEKKNVKYFRDTDTALLEFSSQPVDETREMNENVYVDLDKDCNLVSMTIEHAQAAAKLPSVTVEEI